MDIKRFITWSVALKISGAFLYLLLIRVHFITGQSGGMVLLDDTQSLSAFRAALNEGANVNFCNKDGFTALMLAAQRGDLVRAQLLLERGADVNLTSYKDKDTALHMALSNISGNYPVVKLLLQYGANPKAQNIKGDTPLHKAVNIQDDGIRMKIFSLLVKHGANINAQNDIGYTPLHIAIMMRNRAWVQQLMKALGQLINLTLQTKKEKLTPRALALSIGETDIAQILIGKPEPIGLTGDINTYNSVGLNGLMLAVIGGDSPLVQRLLQLGANINAQSLDDFGYTPLQLALLQSDLPIAELLLKNRANAALKNKQGNTSVHIILEVHDPEMQKQEFQLLAKYKVNLNARDNKGETILHRLVRENDKQLLSYLVQNFKKQLDAQVENLNYETPLALARKLGRNDLIPELAKLR